LAFINPGLNPTATPGPGPAIAGMVRPPEPDVSAPHRRAVENEDGSVDFVEPEPEDAARVPAARRQSGRGDGRHELPRRRGGARRHRRRPRKQRRVLRDARRGHEVRRQQARRAPEHAVRRIAAGCIHPVMLEAGVRFQASARGEMLPAAGPVRTQIFGDETPRDRAAANRKRDWLNYYLTERTRTTTPTSTRCCSWSGSTAACSARSTATPSARGCPVSRSLSPKDLLVSYHATSLHGSERVTHIEPHVSKAALKRLQIKAWYRDATSRSTKARTARPRRTRPRPRAAPPPSGPRTWPTSYTTATACST
jgi:hypothetical protein